MDHEPVLIAYSQRLASQVLLVRSEVIRLAVKKRKLKAYRLPETKTTRILHDDLVEWVRETWELV